VDELRRASLVIRAQRYRRRLFSEFDRTKEVFLPWAPFHAGPHDRRLDVSRDPRASGAYAGGAILRGGPSGSRRQAQVGDGVLQKEMPDEE
jgi:hypothetical protein